MMGRIAKSLIGVGLLILLGGTIDAAEAFPAGRFIGIADLTRAERNAVQRLTRPFGKPPWITWGFRFGEDPKPDVNRTTLDVYLNADAEKGRLRYGRLLTIVFDPAKIADRSSSWRVESVSKYARVALPGDPRAEITEKWDITRPFTVPNDLDDDAIVSLVDFIRSSPEWSELPKHLAPRKVDGSIPIVFVRDFEGGLKVCLQNKEWEGWFIEVVRREGEWAVRKISFWIN
jgi:hypothetical protein